MSSSSPTPDIHQNAILAALAVDAGLAGPTRRYRTGETIGLGAGPDFVVSGLVSLRARSPGGRLAEIALLGGEAILDRSYLDHVIPGLECTAVTHCVIVSLAKARLDGPTSAKLEVLEQRFHDYLVSAMAGMVSTAYCRTKPRILRWLAMATMRLGSSDIFTSQSVLADCLGLARPRLNIALQELLGEGLLDLGRGRISVVAGASAIQASDVPAGTMPPSYRIPGRGPERRLRTSRRTRQA